jgi:hypothetical protein
MTSSVARFGVRTVRAMQPSAARGKAAERVAKASPGVSDRGDKHVAEALMNADVVQL